MHMLGIVYNLMIFRITVERIMVFMQNLVCPIFFSLMLPALETEMH